MLALLIRPHSDFADAFPNGDIAQWYQHEWVNKLIKDARSSAAYSTRTINTARWAREQVKRQLTASQNQGTVMTA
jgi:importin subunit beta-1